MAEIKVNARYSRSGAFDYETRLERINIDKERRSDVLSGDGFIISSPKAIKYDLKDPNGIFSTKYGPTLQDMDEGSNRYRCDCGHLKARFNQGETCPVCGTKVTFKGDNFSMFGYPVLKDPYHIIHPNLYMSIAFFIGEKDFKNIITPVNKKDEDGHEIELKRPKDEPFFGIGMLDFYDRFDEIMEYYLLKKPSKRDYYESIMNDREKVFIQSIPVFTIHLRPYRLDGGVLHYEGTNAVYYLIVKLVAQINDDSTKMGRKKKPKDTLLFDLQMKYMELYEEITKIISGKKGSRVILWIPTARSVENNLLNCWKAKLERAC